MDRRGLLSHLRGREEVRHVQNNGAAEGQGHQAEEERRGECRASDVRAGHAVRARLQCRAQRDDGKAVQVVDIRLTPRVEGAWFHCVHLKVHPVQAVGFKYQPAPLRGGSVLRDEEELGEGGGALQRGVGRGRGPGGETVEVEHMLNPG